MYLNHFNTIAEKISKDLQDLHGKEKIPSDIDLDRMIGIASDAYEEKFDISELIEKYGPENRTYKADTTYSFISRMYKLLMPYKPISFLDLGSGNGRILFYGALLFRDIDFYGIELVKERAYSSDLLRQRLSLNIKIINGNVLKVDLPKVDCICLINSLFPSSMPKLLHKLRDHAKTNPFILVSASTCNITISAQDWLQELELSPPPEHKYDLRLFKSL